LYSTVIGIEARDRSGLVVDIASVLNALSVKIMSFNARNTEEGLVSVLIGVDVRNRDELVGAMARLMSISGLIDVRRANM